MEYRRQLRVLLKMRSKGLLFTNFGVCVMVTLIAHILSMLGGYAAGLVLPPANDVLYAPDITVYYPQFLLFYGILLGIMLLVSPLTMGSYAWFSELSMMRKPKIREIFNWLGDVRLTCKAFGASLWFAGLCLAWSLAFLGIPIATVIFISANVTRIAVSAVVFLSGLITLLTISGVVLTFVRVISYLPALYVLAAHPDMRIREVFRECSLFMAGRRWEFLELVLSFTGWFLLQNFSCGLIALFVKPYFSLTVLSFTQHARGTWLAEHGKNAVDAVWTPETTRQEEDGMDV